MSGADRNPQTDPAEIADVNNYKWGTSLGFNVSDVKQFMKTTGAEKYGSSALDLSLAQNSSPLDMYIHEGQAPRVKGDNGKVRAIDPGLIAAFTAWKAAQDSTNTKQKEYSQSVASAPGRDATILTGPAASLLGGSVAPGISQDASDALSKMTPLQRRPGTR